jgi:hypothetical protein
MYFYRYFFHIIVLSLFISIIETFSIQNTHNDVNQVEDFLFKKKLIIELFLFKVSRRQIESPSVKNRFSQENEKKYHKPDKDQLPSAKTQTYLLTMFPVAKGDHVFNRGGEQEWEILRDTDTKFAIYGMRKD